MQENEKNYHASLLLANEYLIRGTEYLAKCKPVASFFSNNLYISIILYVCLLFSNIHLKIDLPMQ